MATNKRRGESLTDTATQLPAGVWLNGDEEDGRFGTDAVQAWRVDGGSVAVQVRHAALSKKLRERKGSKPFTQSAKGGYLRSWIIPCRDDATMRQIVLDLLAEMPAESDPITAGDSLKSSAKTSADFYREGKSGLSPQPQDDSRKADKPDSSEWFDDRGCFGAEACCAFQRGGKWVFQTYHPQVWRFFTNRKAEIVGHSVGGMGQLRQYALPIKSKAKAVALVKAALASIGKQD
jgi:hypothetical protein